MKNITYTLKQVGVLTVVLTLALAANFAYGQWSDPTSNPPADNAAAPINVSADYQAKLGDLGAVRVRSDQYCDAAGNNCFVPSASTTTPPSGDVVVIAGRCYGPLDNVTVDGVVRNIIEEVACNPQTCQVELVSRARNDRDTRTVTIEQTSVAGLAGIYFWQHSDDGYPSVFNTARTAQTASQSWGSSWNDRSERIYVFYMDDTKQSRYGSTILGYMNRSDTHTEYATFPLVAGATASIVGQQDGAVTAGYAQISATVLSCTNS